MVVPRTICLLRALDMSETRGPERAKKVGLGFGVGDYGERREYRKNKIYIRQHRFYPMLFFSVTQNTN